MGLVQGICLTAVFFPIEDPNIFVAFLFVTAFSGAVMDVVIDGLMVVQQRRDPNSGSEDL